jgi:hypothetical protein
MVDHACSSPGALMRLLYEPGVAPTHEATVLELPVLVTWYARSEYNVGGLRSRWNQRVMRLRTSAE